MVATLGLASESSTSVQHRPPARRAKELRSHPEAAQKRRVGARDGAMVAAALLGQSAPYSLHDVQRTVRGSRVEGSFPGAAASATLPHPRKRLVRMGGDATAAEPPLVHLPCTRQRRDVRGA